MTNGMYWVCRSWLAVGRKRVFARQRNTATTCRSKQNCLKKQFGSVATGISREYGELCDGYIGAYRFDFRNWTGVFTKWVSCVNSRRSVISSDWFKNRCAWNRWEALRARPSFLYSRYSLKRGDVNSVTHIDLNKIVSILQTKTFRCILWKKNDSISKKNHLNMSINTGSGHDLSAPYRQQAIIKTSIEKHQYRFMASLGHNDCEHLRRGDAKKLMTS